jgi:hypothetical protein
MIPSDLNVTFTFLGAQPRPWRTLPTGCTRRRDGRRGSRSLEHRRSVLPCVCHVSSAELLQQWMMLGIHMGWKTSNSCELLSVLVMLGGAVARWLDASCEWLAAAILWELAAATSSTSFWQLLAGKGRWFEARDVLKLGTDRFVLGGTLVVGDAWYLALLWAKVR